MKKRNVNLSGEPYEAPSTRLVFFEADDALCQTSLSGGEIQPGTGENWGNF